MIGQEADRQANRLTGRHVSSVGHEKSTLGFDHDFIVLHWFLFSGVSYISRKCAQNAVHDIGSYVSVGVFSMFDC